MQRGKLLVIITADITRWVRERPASNPCPVDRAEWTLWNIDAMRDVSNGIATLMKGAGVTFDYVVGVNRDGVAIASLISTDLKIDLCAFDPEFIMFPMDQFLRPNVALLYSKNGSKHVDRPLNVAIIHPIFSSGIAPVFAVKNIKYAHEIAGIPEPRTFLFSHEFRHELLHPYIANELKGIEFAFRHVTTGPHVNTDVDFTCNYIEKCRPLYTAYHVSFLSSPFINNKWFDDAAILKSYIESNDRAARTDMALMQFVESMDWNGRASNVSIDHLPERVDPVVFACPSCGKPAPRGRFWECESCHVAFDTFHDRASCPDPDCYHHVVPYETTQCPWCKHRTPFLSWVPVPVVE